MSVIADKQPSHDREWDCQCARCGSSIERELCEDCEGEGWVMLCVEEWGEDGVEFETCQSCYGKGGWWRCLSSAEWCKAHPLDGRADVKRGQCEWFEAAASTSKDGEA